MTEPRQKIELPPATVVYMPTGARIAVGAATLLAIALAANQLFNYQAFGIVLLEGLYLYVLAGLFLGASFLVFPTFKDRGVTALDWLLATAAVAAAGWFAW